MELSCLGSTHSGQAQSAKVPCLRWDEATVRDSSAACADELGMSSRSKRGAQGSPGFRRRACERQYRSSSDKAHQPSVHKRGSVEIGEGEVGQERDSTSCAWMIAREKQH